MQGVVYLLHFERPIASNHPCRHYIGWALDLNARLALHRAGRGARLTQVAVERGIGFEVARTWEGSRELERYLKESKRGPRLCPICRQAHGRLAQPARIPAEQLALPFDDFPPPPQLPLDGYEVLALRRWRQARAALAPLAGLDATDCDIPY